MIQHHPSPEILAEYAGGALHAGAMLVVACHIETCAVCRSEVSLWEGTGGALLEDATPETLSDGALERMMARLDGAEPVMIRHPVPHFLDRFDLPAPLKGRAIGRRRRVTPNIWFAPVDMPDGGSARTYLVYAGQSTVLAELVWRAEAQGRSVIVADGDVRSRTLTALFPDAMQPGSSQPPASPQTSHCTRSYGP